MNLETSTIDQQEP